MAFKKIAATTQPLTLELAYEFGTMTPMPGERELKPAHVGKLAALLENGKFTNVDWHFAHLPGDTRKYRVDGQHSSKMLAEVPAEKFPQILATVTEWQVDSLTLDAVPLFEIFNQPWSTRTNDDIMGVRISGYSDINQINRKFLVKIANSIAIWQASENNDRKDAYYVARRKNPDMHLAPPVLAVIPDARMRGSYFADPIIREFAQWCWEQHEQPTVKLPWAFALTGVVAEMFDDWRKDRDIANQFWNLVVTESHPDREDFSRELGERLKVLRQPGKKTTQLDFRAEARKFYKKFLKFRQQTTTSEPGTQLVPTEAPSQETAS